MSQAFGQSFGKVPFTYLSLCALDRVRDPPKLSALRVEVDHQVGRPRVAVARLTHRAWIQEPAPTGEIHFAALRGKPAVERLAGDADRQRHVAVPDEDERRLGQLEASSAPSAVST